MSKVVRDMISQMCESFYERDHIIKASWAALLSKQHVLLLGAPGTAKSKLIQALCSHFDGSTYFQWLMTRFTTPEELFGPVSMKGLENDDYRRITTGKVPEAHIGFLDEIFKANSAILNSMLTITNERAYDNGRTRMKVPLLSMFGASNELPQEDELAPMYDRFLLRFDVPYIQDGANWESLMEQEDMTYKPKLRITLEDLKLMQEEVLKVKLPTNVVSIMRDIKMALERDGVRASDRRWKQTTVVLRAWAYIAGRKEVVLQDLAVLCDMLWQEPEERAKIVSVVLSITNPLDLEATKLYDDILDVYSKWDKSKSTSTMEVSSKIRMAMERLNTTIKTGKDEMLGKTREVHKQFGEWYRDVLKSMDT